MFDSNLKGLGYIYMSIAEIINFNLSYFLVFIKFLQNN